MDSFTKTEKNRTGSAKIDVKELSEELQGMQISIANEGKKTETKNEPKDAKMWAMIATKIEEFQAQINEKNDFRSQVNSMCEELLEERAEHEKLIEKNQELELELEEAEFDVDDMEEKRFKLYEQLGKAYSIHEDAVEENYKLVADKFKLSGLIRALINTED